MRIAVDTNVLIRLLLADDRAQYDIALRTLEKADAVVLPLVALCEVAWVLARTYRLPRADIASMLRKLTRIKAVEYDFDEVEAGLALLDAGGDFADGVIARQARRDGAEVFVSFDRKAVKRLVALGENACLPD